MAIASVAAFCLLTELSALAAPYAYESFSGMTVGPGLVGSGSDSYGWTATGWTNGSDPHFETTDPTPNLTYNIVGGATLDGSDRAVLLTTNPEPIASTLTVWRSLAVGHFTTIYFSCLVRPIAVGTGSDRIALVFASGSTTLAEAVFTPDLGETYFNLRAGGGGGSYPTLWPGQTHLLVFRLFQGSANTWQCDIWLNPTASISTSPQLHGFFNTPPYSLFNNLKIQVSSTDTGGPTSSIVLDEFRIGFVWSDVVPSAPAPALVPDLTVTPAAKLRWQSITGRNYQPQFSYDLNSWFNLGPLIPGNGTAKELFDSTTFDARKFYRVQSQ